MNSKSIGIGTSVLSIVVLGGVLWANNENQAPPAPSPGAAPPNPCASGPFREFDFWVGQWVVRGPRGKVAGENDITSEEGGCAIVEHWRSAAGGTGQSLNFYDPKAKRWKQKWVSQGSVLEMEGEFKDGAMILEGPLQYVGQGRETILKGTWTKLPDGRLRQYFEESDDGGKTWKPWFDGYYSRKQAQ
jgi:hypothetical protein